MGFRNPRDADRLRIDALEEDVEDKAARIAELEAALARRDAAERQPPRGKRAKSTRRAEAKVPKVDGVPEGARWSFETTHPKGTWKLGIAWMVALAAIVGVVVAREGLHRGIGIMVAVFGVPGLLLLHRSGLVVDREKRRITRWDSIVIPVRRTWEVGGHRIVLEERSMTPKDGESWQAGFVFLGPHLLFKDKKAAAQRTARRIAAFLGVAYSERRERDEAVERRAIMPLMVVMTVALVGGLLMWMLSR